MIDELESELREALAQRADALPPQAYARLGETDYHPRSPAWRKGLALGGTAGIATAAGIVVAVVGLGTGTERAFAGWTPSPTVPAGGQIASAESRCKSAMATPAERERAREQASGSHTGPWPAAADGGEWQTTLTDTRGPYTIVLLTDAVGQASCLTGPGFPQPGIGADERAAGSTASTIPVGQIGEITYGFSRATNEQAYMKTSGRVGAGVSAVTLVLGDGSHIAASTANGWFLAWWPGSQRTVAAEVTTATGTNTMQLSDPVPTNPGT
jgi:hypothetical protein